jgi:hypothetical protein
MNAETCVHAIGDGNTTREAIRFGPIELRYQGTTDEPRRSPRRLDRSGYRPSAYSPRTTREVIRLKLVGSSPLGLFSSSALIILFTVAKHSGTARAWTPVSQRALMIAGVAMLSILCGR